MKRVPSWRIVCVISFMSLPALAYAQASITGVVQDASGAVLPGVTVEASSPALIEKVRATTTDGAGQYRVVDLRPGTYRVTFALPGFNTVSREGIGLAGSFTATVNAEMRVGAIEETITVTGESPVVDVQGVTQQRVMDKEAIAVIPSGRTVRGLTVLVPGVTFAITPNQAPQDVGGNSPGWLEPSMAIHGGRTGDSRQAVVDGLSAANSVGSGAATPYMPNMSSAQEVVINVSGASAETQTGGVIINTIPRDGGNRFIGTLFAGYNNDSMAGNNLTPELIRRGLPALLPPKMLGEINPGFGGPIKRDKIWFFTAARAYKAQNFVPSYNNLNAGKTTLPDAWLYLPDRNGPPTYLAHRNHSANGRLTWQATPTNKFSGFYDYQTRCTCPKREPWYSPNDAGLDYAYGWPLARFMSSTWSSPVTNRILLEAGIANFSEAWRWARGADETTPRIPVIEQSTGFAYHASTPLIGAFNNIQFPRNWGSQTNMRASMTYVTGSHAFKVGMTDGWSYYDFTGGHNPTGLTYRFNNGVPNQITENVVPQVIQMNVDADLGLFAQDKWTVKRLTASYGVRFDYFSNSYPDQTLGPSRFTPTRNITFPGARVAHWADLNPRLGVAYDLFGNGRTALKASLNRYVLGQAVGGIYGQNKNPAQSIAYQTTRSWSDANSNFEPDCDLLNPLANGECGALANLNLGNPLSQTTYDPAILNGHGNRPFNWEWSTSVQRELLPGTAINVGYFHRTFGNFAVTDNRAVAPADYTTFDITAPTDARLPGGGGATIGGLKDLNPNKVGQVDPYLTFARNYGAQYERWDGFDIAINARLPHAAIVQGGFSAGRRTTDNCAVLAKLPEVNPLGGPYCHVSEKALAQSQIKLLGAYSVPKVDVQLGATFQSVPGPVLVANYAVPSALAAQTLGRPLSGGAANATVNLVAPGTAFGDRLYQLDLRMGKNLKLGPSRSLISLDLYNALNGAAVLTENSNYASWRAPQYILTPRLAKISLQFDF